MMLQELRQEVWRCNLELPKNHLVKMTSGNVSGRDSDAGLVVIKPSGVPYEDLTPENMVIVDLDGKVVEGELTPSIDTITHLYVYQHRADVNGICHTHSPYASIFAVLGEPIPATLTSCGLVGGEIPVGDYYPPLGDDAIGKEIIRALSDCDSLAVIMQSHGVFTIGESPAQATRVAVETEEIALITHNAMLRGNPIVLTNQQVKEMILNYSEKYGQQ